MTIENLEERTEMGKCGNRYQFGALGAPSISAVGGLCDRHKLIRRPWPWEHTVVWLGALPAARRTLLNIPCAEKDP
jgi:hypothetical protein